MNREEKSAYNRAYAIANKERIAAKRAARRAGLGDQVRRCTIEGCNRVYDANGYCARHYGAFWRHGDPLAKIQTQHHGLTLEGRFLSYVKKGRGCWEWIGLKNEPGYGVLHVGKRIILAHRVSHMLYKGEIPDGLFVLHRCDRPSCVAPKHLWLGTIADNQADMARKGRGRGNSMPGQLHPNAKLTEKKVRHILSSSEMGKNLARRYGVAQTTISDIRKGRSWRHV